MENGIKNYYWAVGIILASLLLVPFLIIATSEGGRIEIVSEGGIIETLTVVCYFLCIVILVTRGGVELFKKSWHIQVAILCLALRELDFHKRFTTTGIFKIRFYLGSDVPVMEKVAGALAIALIVVVVGFLILRHLRWFVAGLRRRDFLTITVSIGFGLMFASKGIDGIGRKLAGRGGMISERTSEAIKAFEETFELGIPVMFLIAVCLYFSQRARSKELNESP